jgi:chromosome segregation ATPase
LAVYDKQIAGYKERIVKHEEEKTKAAAEVKSINAKKAALEKDLESSKIEQGQYKEKKKALEDQLHDKF